MARKGKHLEKLVSRIERALHGKSAKVSSPGYVSDIDTGRKREVDILIEYQDQPHPFTIVIECRDRKNKQDVRWIEQLTEKRNSIIADKVIAVSTSGFSTEAINKAEKHGILVLNLNKLPNDLGKVILDRVLTIYHCYSHLDKVLVLLNPKHEALLEKFKTETSGMDASKIKLYKNDHSFWGTLSQMISGKIPENWYQEAERGIKRKKGLVVNFTNPSDCLFVKVGSVFAQIDRVEAILTCSVVLQESVFDTNYLYNPTDKNQVFAKHAETQFTHEDRDITLSLTSKDDKTIVQTQVSRKKQKK